MQFEISPTTPTPTHTNHDVLLYCNFTLFSEMAMLLLFYQFFSSRYKFRAYLSLTIKNFDRMSLGAGWGSESEQLIYIFRLMYYWLIVITCSCYTNQTTGSFDLVADHMILLNLHNLADDLTKDVKHRVDCDDAERWRSRDMITSWHVSQRKGKQKQSDDQSALSVRCSSQQNSVLHT